MEILLVVFLCVLAGSEVTSVTTVIKVEEGRDIILPCSLSTKEDINFEKFEWKKDGLQVFLYDAGIHSNNGREGQDQQFKGRVDYFRDKLKSGDASIIIRNTKEDDKGIYTCGFSNHPGENKLIVLYVVTTVIKVEEGRDVTLPCSLSTKEDITSQKFEWKKDGLQVFFYDAGIHSNNGREGQDQQFIRRVDYFRDKLKSGDASITIRNTKVTDSGEYTCNFPDLRPSQIFHIHLVVYEPVHVKEGSNVTLPCSLSTKEDITSQKFEWKKDGRQVFLYESSSSNSIVVPRHQDKQFIRRVKYFPDQLTSGNASITISNMTLTDRGLYTCDFPDLKPSQIFHIHLDVYGDLKDRTGEKGSAPKPYIQHLQETRQWARLQCETRGDPVPQLHWQDSAGNNLTADGPQVSQAGGYDTLQITVNKTGHYVCVATQEKIRHQINGTTHVYIEGEIIKENTVEVQTGLPVWAIALIVISVLVGVVGIYIYKRNRTLNLQNSHLRRIMRFTV